MFIPTRALRASWQSTLHLPKPPLPARPQVPPLPSHLTRCTEELYKWQRDQNRPKFVLHDGPPYANGSLHLGHALNKILKDIICRFQITQGKNVQYVPGWDCHGLPIEIKALQALKKDHEDLSPVAIRKAARILAEKTIKEQMSAFKSWAVIGDWENAYTTMDPGYELNQLRVFRDMVKKGVLDYHREDYLLIIRRSYLSFSDACLLVSIFSNCISRSRVRIQLRTSLSLCIYTIYIKLGSFARLCQNQWNFTGISRSCNLDDNSLDASCKWSNSSEPELRILHYIS
jgi:hypothetical protein